MTRRARVVGVAAAVLVVVGTVSAAVALNGNDGGGGEASASTPTSTTTSASTTTTGAGKVEAASSGDAAGLRQFDTCRGVVDEARKQASRYVTPYGLPFPGYARGSGDVLSSGDGAARTTAAPAASASQSGAGDTGASGGATSAGSAPSGATEYSGTNLQEAGVDEPDIVKNDADVAFTLNGTRLRSVLFDAGGTPRNGDAIDLDVTAGAELLRVEDEVVVLSSTAAFSTRIVVVDASDPSALQIARQFEVEGRYLSARQVGDTIRLVVTQNGPAFDFVYPTSGAPADQQAALAHNRAAIGRATLAEWLPDVTIDQKTRLVPAPACDDVYLTQSFAGPGSTSVVTISPSEGKVLDAASVMATATEVYSTADDLYVATSSWQAGPETSAGGEVTEIHRFDISDPTRSVYEASGTVPGHLLRPPWFVPSGPVAQWAMSENDGDLRVATTVDGPNGTENQVTVLRAAGSALAPIGSLTGIARGEQLYAVRFMGDRGYVVTYRRVDPLFVLDLSDPSKPRSVGELKMPGYSAYLHPIGDGLLLGIGQDDANNDGIADGTQASVFDVSDPARPTRVAQLDIGPRGTIAGVESDPRSFTWWQRPARAVLTVTNWSDPNGFRGAVALEPGRSSIREIGRLADSEPPRRCWMPALRTRIIGDTLIVFSPFGVRTGSLDDLRPRSMLSYGDVRDDEACRGSQVQPVQPRPARV